MRSQKLHKIWIADDDEAIRIVLEETLNEAGFETQVFKTGDDLVKQLESESPDLIITDIQMPGMLGYDVLKHINNNFEDLPVIVMTAFADMQAAVESFGGGAFEYIPKPFDLEEALQIVERALEDKPKTKGLKKDNKLDIIGESQAMQNVYRAIGKLSNTIATVLIQGESGTGKELIAKSLHKNSPRHDMPFIALNMADIPKELVESELFGHEKGSFTGAVDKRVGRFEQANGGTLFLDEIGDMPLDSQTRLLRVLSNKEFYRVGGDKPIKVDVRIIAATHQNLSNLVSQKHFREDLFYRLNVIKIDVPPMKDRKEDIDDLSKYFLKNYSDSLDEDLRVLSEDAKNIMMKYDWPGNVRQLENVCYWLTLMSPNQNVKAQDLPTEVKEYEMVDVPSSSWEDGMKNWLKNVSLNIDSGLSEIAITKIEKMLIKTALERSNGKKNDAAQILGWGRNTLSKKMKEHGI
ncbi:MAG: nitrogen regulation protein NR(I) [Gammaproteobacteria bacterium]|tara:strand:- start:1720 stop:3111 length:1392 start_codon:yes stop_codon:yes gene_type:complete